MNETVNQENKTAEQPERTFTQEEMNAIIRDRLSREREKYADYDTLKDKAQKFDAAEEASKSELQKAQERAESLQAQLNALTQEAEIQKARAKVASEKGIPANLLTGSTEEECKNQADAILAFAKAPGYPAVKDAGDVGQKALGTSGKTRDQFNDWFESNFH